jgi:hypothetical protein
MEDFLHSSRQSKIANPNSFDDLLTGGAIEDDFEAAIFHVLQRSISDRPREFIVFVEHRDVLCLRINFFHHIEDVNVVATAKNDGLNRVPVALLKCPIARSSNGSYKALYTSRLRTRRQASDRSCRERK